MFALIVVAVAAALILGAHYYRAQRHDRQGTRRPTAWRRELRVPLVLEVALDVGTVVVLAGVGLGAAQKRVHLTAGAQVAIFAGAATLLFLAGLIMFRMREPAIQRLAASAWFGSIAGAGAAAGFAVHGLASGPYRNEVTVLTAGLVTAVYALALRLIRQHAVQLAALCAGLVMAAGSFVAAAGDRSIGDAFLAAAVMLWLFGVVWVLLGWRYLDPMSQTVMAGVLAAIAAPGLVVVWYPWGYAAGIGTAAAAMAVSVPLRDTGCLSVGAFALFGYLVPVVVIYLDRPLGIPTVVSIIGALIIGLAVATAVLLRGTRPAMRGSQGPALR